MRAGQSLQIPDDDTLSGVTVSAAVAKRGAEGGVYFAQRQAEQVQQQEQANAVKESFRRAEILGRNVATGGEQGRGAGNAGVVESVPRGTERSALIAAAALGGEFSVMAGDLPADIASGSAGPGGAMMSGPVSGAVGAAKRVSAAMAEYKGGALESIKIDTELAAQRRDVWALYGNALEGAVIESLLPGSPVQLGVAVLGGPVAGKIIGPTLGVLVSKAPWLGMGLGDALDAVVAREAAGRVGNLENVLPTLEQGGLTRLATPRTPGLGPTSTTAELLQTGGIPGREGVVLTQPHVAFNDLWSLSEQTGVEFVLTREYGAFVLRSGSPTSAPIPAGVRPIVHTHPLDELGVNSLLPSKADINVLNRYWAMNPTVPRPVSQVVTGPNQTTPFRATGLDPWGN